MVRELTFDSMVRNYLLAVIHYIKLLVISSVGFTEQLHSSGTIHVHMYNVAIYNTNLYTHNVESQY